MHNVQAWRVGGRLMGKWLMTWNWMNFLRSSPTSALHPHQSPLPCPGCLYPANRVILLDVCWQTVSSPYKVLDGLQVMLRVSAQGLIMLVQWFGRCLGGCLPDGHCFWPSGCSDYLSTAPRCRPSVTREWMNGGWIDGGWTSAEGVITSSVRVMWVLCCKCLFAQQINFVN